VRNVIVLGAGRSGTSLVGGILADAGYHTGARLLPANDANPRGYFEDGEVNAVNEALLAPVVPARPAGRLGALPPWRLRPRAGERWLSAVPPRTSLDARPDLAERMTALLARRPYAYKDPRFCLTLPAWRPHLAADTAFVCVFRDPARTVASMLAMIRGGRAWPAAQLWTTRRRLFRLWVLQYRHVLEQHRHRGDWRFVHYDQVVDGRALAPLEQLLGVGLRADFADPTLRRSSPAGAVPRTAQATYAQLCALADHLAP
jgi:hypothetical protein